MKRATLSSPVTGAVVWGLLVAAVTLVTLEQMVAMEAADRIEAGSDGVDR